MYSSINTPKKAIALVMAYILIATMIVAGGAQLASVTSDFKSTYRTSFIEQAFWQAEAGLVRARLALVNEELDTWQTDEEGSYVLSYVSGQNSYSVTVTGVPGDYVIESTGRVSLAGGAQEFTKTLTLNAVTPSVFQFAAFADDSMIVNSNAHTYSYNSSIDPGAAVTGANGSIGTNGLLIILNSNAQINGSVGTGEGGSVTQGANVTVTGEITHDVDMELPEVDIPASVLSAVSLGNVNVNTGTSLVWPANSVIKLSNLNINSNADLTIGAGSVIYITGGMNMNSNSEINILGDVEFYIDGSFNLNSNGMMNLTQVPANLKVNATGGTGQNVNFNSNSDFYGVLYAPEATVMINSNADIYGSIVGRTITFNSNGDVYYDETLGLLAGYGSGYIFVNWNEE